MTGGLVAAECTACGRVTFPRALWCPACGAQELRPRTLRTGTVEETTTVRRAGERADWAAVRIGAVRPDGGPVVIARLEDGVEAGERVRLEGGEGAPVARSNLPPQEPR